LPVVGVQAVLPLEVAVAEDYYTLHRLRFLRVAVQSRLVLEELQVIQMMEVEHQLKFVVVKEIHQSLVPLLRQEAEEVLVVEVFNNLFQELQEVQVVVDMDIQAILLMVLVMQTLLQDHLELKHHQMAFLDLEIQVVMVLYLVQVVEVVVEVPVVLAEMLQAALLVLVA
jgi:hypothetical protein